MSLPGTLGGGKQNPGQNTNNMTIGSGLVVPQDQGTQQETGLSSVSTGVSSAVNVGAGSNIAGSDNTSGNNKDSGGDNSRSTLNVNNILADANTAATAAQTITLPQVAIASPVAAANATSSDTTIVKTSTGTKISINNAANNTNNAGNLDQYVLASTGVPSASNTGTGATAPATLNNITFNATHLVPTPAIAVAPLPFAVDPNSSATTTNHQQLQNALLQQNAAIMQQNAATLQHLQILQQTNKLMMGNPDTLDMLAPIMNTNLTTTNPVQLLATPSLVPNPSAAGTFLSTTVPTTLPGSIDLNGAPTFSAAPVGVQPQPGIPIPAPTMGIAPGVPQPFPVPGFTNNGIADANSNNEAVQNKLRTAFMLQNGGLPILQQGIIPQQQQQHVIPAPSAGGNLVITSTPATNNTAPFGIVPATVSTTKSDKTGGDNKKVDASNNGSGAAAAANAAASVLPPASMNLPLQQQLQQPQLHAIPQIGIDLNSNNNAIALLNGTAPNATNGLQLAGLATLQQQQQLNPTIVFPQINLSDPNSQLQLPLVAQHTKQQLVVNPSAQQAQTAKKQSSIVRPLYLDHDSNCLTAYQCFLRKQIELFEVGHDEMTGTAQGRNTPLSYGQVGIRCRHCAHLPKAARARGGVYYSRTIDGVYQVAQNMSKLHFLKACTLIPENTKNQLKSLQSVSSRASGGKEYWAEGLRVLGIVEEGGMLRFASNAPRSSSTQRSNKPGE